MKNWVKIFLIISILIITIALDLFLFFKTNKAIEEIQNHFNILGSIVENENQNKSKEEIKIIKERWKKHDKNLSLFIEHEEIEKISIKIAVIEENIKNEEYKVALEDISETKFLLEHLQDRYNLNLKNVF